MWESRSARRSATRVPRARWTRPGSSGSATTAASASRPRRTPATPDFKISGPGVPSPPGGHVAHIDNFKGWAESIRQDIDAFKALLESEGSDRESKKLAGAALLYMVSRMDLIPDWN